MNSIMQLFPSEDVQKSGPASKKWPIFDASARAGNRLRNLEKSSTLRLSGSLPSAVKKVSNLQSSIWRKTDFEPISVAAVESVFCRGSGCHLWRLDVTAYVSGGAAGLKALGDERDSLLRRLGVRACRKNRD